MTLLRDDAGLVFEGGGHNRHEGWGGSTVLYFVGATGGSRRPGERRVRRVELCCAGDFSAILDRHSVDRRAVADAYARWADLQPRSAALVA